MKAIGRYAAAFGVIISLASSSDALPAFHSIVRWAGAADVGIIATDPQHLMAIQSNGTIMTTIVLDSPAQEVSISDGGQMLAYATQKNGLFISKIDGSGRISVETGICQALHWSKDASVLLYTLNVPSATDPTQGQLVIYAVHADGSMKTQVFSRAYSAM